MPDKNDRPVLVLGTGPFAPEMADLISEIPGYRVAGFVENMDRDRCKEPLVGCSIIWIDEIQEISASHVAACSLATTHRDTFIGQVSRFGIPFPVLIHPSSRVSGQTALGDGTFVSSGVSISAYSSIGRHVRINRGALVGHHTRIDEFVTIQPGANIAGACRIGARTYIGMGAVVIDRVTIGARCVVGAGAVVVKDVPDNVQVVGVPARIVREGIDGL